MFDEKLIDEYYNFVKNIFESKEVFRKYWDEFLQLDDRKARTTFKKICQNIFIKQFDKHKIPNHEFVDFIMITSVIELLQTTVEYQTFNEWLEIANKESTNEKNCKTLWNDYNKVHGCSGKFRRFFLNYLGKDEKIRLLRMMRIPSDDKIVPFCYQGFSCDYKYKKEWCNYEVDPSECPIVKDKRQMRDSINKLCNLLYSMRNQFVHAGRIPIFAIPSKPLLDIIDFTNVVSITDYVDTKEYEGLIINEVSVEFLYSLLAKNLLKMLDSYLLQKRKPENNSS